MEEHPQQDRRRAEPTNFALELLLKEVYSELKEHRAASKNAHHELVTLINGEILKQVPVDHLQLHVAISEHLSHSPTAKEHGEHHAFTGAVQANVRGAISNMMKTLGTVILIAVGVGMIAGSDTLRDTYLKTPKTTQEAP